MIAGSRLGAADDMRAVVLRVYGDASVLATASAEVPRIAASQQAVVKLAAAAVNRVDLLVRAGRSNQRVDLPLILGVEGAGEIHDLSDDVEGFGLGDQVMLDPHITCGLCEQCALGSSNRCNAGHVLGEHVDGTYAEYVRVPATNCVPKPAGLTSMEAAGAAVGFLTAWHQLVTQGRLQRGEKILIIGGGGGVGSAGVQLAKAMGATVFATTGSPAKRAILESAGADQVAVYNDTFDFATWVLELTDGRGVDLVQNNVGGPTMIPCVRALRHAGRLVGVGSYLGRLATVDLWELYHKEASAIGSHLWTHDDVTHVWELLSNRSVVPIVDKVFTLEQAADAHRHMETQERIGKVILKI